MQIVEMYSHQNGHEHILVHKPDAWQDIEQVIASVDAEACRTKVSREKTMRGRMLVSPEDVNGRFKEELGVRGWDETRTSYWVTADHRLIRKTLALPPEEQKREIEEAGATALYSYNQTDFVKDRIALEVQLGKYAFVAYDLFVKHMAFYVGDVIDVGVEIVPMKTLQAEMSSELPYYEGVLYDLVRHGRTAPAVPIVLVGIGP